MSDQVINVPGVGPINFPDSMSDADIEKAIPGIMAQTVAERKVQSKAAFEANQPKYGKAFVSDLAHTVLNPTLLGDFSRPEFNPVMRDSAREDFAWLRLSLGLEYRGP
jgi:hypothetical protein